MKRGIDPIHVRLLFRGYLCQTVKISWSNAFSRPFSILNFVRQGGILSPHLFSCYLDEVVKRELYDGVGCWMGTNFVGSLGYADDLVLLCPTISGLRHMLRRANDFMLSIDLIFNPAKSVAIRFGFDDCVQFPLRLNGILVKWDNKVTHLGLTITSTLSDDLHVKKLLCDFYARTNGLLCTFIAFPKSILMHLFTVYCTSYHGLMRCALHSPAFNSVCVAWNKAVRLYFSASISNSCFLIITHFRKTSHKTSHFLSFC
jgi:hypothetical protein